MGEETLTPFVNDDELVNKSIKPVIKPEKEIGIDTKDMFYQNIINAGMANALDIGAINAFSQISSSRDQVYSLLDTMAEDSSIAAILETYAEDATEYNDEGRIVWVAASDSNIATYIDFLLKVLKVDKNIYRWVYSLCKYGDVYLRLYRESEYNNILFDNVDEEKRLNESISKAIIDEDARNARRVSNKEEDKKETLTEDIFVKAYAKNDKYVRYMEMVPNPAEMFELTRFGKTAGYIQAPTMSIANNTGINSSVEVATMHPFRYKFKRSDIKLYQPTEFVHACLEDNTSRTPEEVQLFLPRADILKYKSRRRYRYDSEYDSDYDSQFDADANADADADTDVSTTYSVKRGQSLLYSSYKIWRQLQLLENAILLSRLTRSSLVRVIQVEVGDMPKESVIPHMMSIKALFEQKMALTNDGGMNEYTNPGAVENCVYIPTHDGKGTLSMSNLGGDYNIRDIADLDYYQDKFYGSMRVPKQYFGVTSDGAGFDGGKSLSIISSRYAKMIKRIQNTMIQAITDAINLILLNDGLENYINKFTIKMMPPTTQEEIDRRDSLKNKVDFVSSVMDLFSDIDDKTIKLKLLKTLVSNAISNTEVVDLIQEQIDAIEAETQATEDELNKESNSESSTEESSAPSEPERPSFDYDTSAPMDLNSTETVEEPSSNLPDFGDTLPSGEDLGIDLTEFPED